jgi:hypothetical protein
MPTVINQAVVILITALAIICVALILDAYFTRAKKYDDIVSWISKNPNIGITYNYRHYESPNKDITSNKSKIIRDTRFFFLREIKEFHVRDDVTEKISFKEFLKDFSSRQSNFLVNSYHESNYSYSFANAISCRLKDDDLLLHYPLEYSQKTDFYKNLFPITASLNFCKKHS